MTIISVVEPIRGRSTSLRPRNESGVERAISMVAAILFTTMIAIVVPVDPAGAAQSRFTSIANKDCKFAPVGDEPGEDDDQLKTCTGLGGTEVLVNALGTRLRIGFRWLKGNHPRKITWAVEAWSAGFTVDWRGSGSGKGFAPYAAIIRMKFQKKDMPAAGDQVLAVIRVQNGTACIMGAVDAGEHRNAHVVAHALADAAPAFVCGKDKLVIGGMKTPAADEIARGIVEQ